MPLSTKTGQKLITPEFANQIANNFKIADLSSEDSSQDFTEVTVSRTDEKKSKYSDVANLHFTRGKKAEFKGFFSSNEVTLVQGVELCVNFIMKEVKAGRLTISRNGIEKVGE